LSQVFRDAFTNTTGLSIELYESSGALGAAIGAGIGAGIFENREEAFRGLEKTEVLNPDPQVQNEYKEAYAQWHEILKHEMGRT